MGSIFSPERLGLASSLQAFFAGLSNATTAGSSRRPDGQRLRAGSGFRSPGFVRLGELEFYRAACAAGTVDSLRTCCCR